MRKYLCYDIRGIQSFIFKIPKLKYIVGGSALIDRFDRETVRNNIKVDGIEYIYSAGGKGAFLCDTDNLAESVQKVLIDEAQKIGLDIRFGRSQNFSEAALNADTLFPYVPKSLEGEPCNISGLYPVSEAGEEHEIVKKRLEVNRSFEDRLLPGIDLEELVKVKKEIEFFRNVSNEDNDGKNGAIALGNRNRWAVICMDGNDMGKQFREAQKTMSNTDLAEWIKEMSVALDRGTCEATKTGIQDVIKEWVKTKDFSLSSDKVILPIRPILIGGDDIVVICHVSFATTFVKTVKDIFNKQSKLNKKLWVATNGELTISASILFCPVTLPLHMAISYTEQLLESAKSRGRNEILGQNYKASVACLDWEQITESVIDSHQARRERELMFHDADLDKDILLTTRPCTFDEFKKIEELAENYKNVPTSIRYKVLPALKKGYSERLAFIAEILKHQTKLAEDLWEFDDSRDTKWRDKNNKKRTPVIDALLLLEEIKRMEKETAND